MRHLLILLFSMGCFVTSASSQVAKDSIAVDTTAVNMLRELTVTAPHVNIRYQGMDYIIDNIKGSQLSEAGSMMDMLSWTPGISVTPDGSLQVFGVNGSPIVYLNGIRLIGLSEIETLSSKMVKSIEVIRKPGAEYPAGTASVIKITTFVPLSEVLNVSLSERASIYRRYSNRNSFNLWGAHRNMVASASLNYDVTNNKQYAKAYEDILNKTGESIRKITTDETDLIHLTRWVWFGGITWTPNDDNQFQIQYSGNSSARRRTFVNDRYINTPEYSSNVNYDSRNKSTPVNHGLIGSYTHSFSKSTLILTTTYNRKSSDSEERVIDNEDGTMTQLNLRNSNSQMWTGKSDYEWRIGKGPRQSVGLYSGRYWQNTNSDYTASGEQNSNFSVVWGEAYYMFNWDVFKYSIRAGLRGRYEHQKYDVMFGGAGHHDAKSHLNIVPNLSIYHRFTKKFAMNFYYKYNYSLPSFADLNPAAVLTDLLFYEVGNPDLKTTRTHEFAIVADLPSLQFVAEYNKYDNEIISITSPIENSEFFLVKPENMGGNYNLKLSASYNFSPIKNMTIYTSGLVKRSHVEYLYMNELVKRNQFMTQFWANVNYRPVKSFFMFLRARYTSPQLFENIRIGYSCDISLGGNLQLLKSKLNLRLEVNDILGRSVTPSWQSYSPNLMRSRINKYDTRGIVFSATYKFTLTKDKYDELDDVDDLDRM